MEKNSIFLIDCGYLPQFLRLMTINSRPVNAMIVRNGVSADFGVLVVSGGAVTIVDGTVCDRVVFTGTGGALVTENAGAIVSRGVLSGSPMRSNP